MWLNRLDDRPQVYSHQLNTSLQILARYAPKRRAGAPFMGMRPRRSAYDRVLGARHPAPGSHPRADARGTCSAVRGRAPERRAGAPLGMRPRRCAQARVCPSAIASRFRVRLRPVSRRPVCGSRRIAPRFANVDRSLQRPFPHRRFA